MTELEKIEYTKGFVDKLAEGINPIDGTPIAEGDLLNNVRISRCMYYVSDILRRVIENGGIEGKKPAKRGRAPFALSDSARRGLLTEWMASIHMECILPITLTEIFSPPILQIYTMETIQKIGNQCYITDLHHKNNPNSNLTNYILHS